MSNQFATDRQLALRESIVACRSAVEIVLSFHNIHATTTSEQVAKIWFDLAWAWRLIDRVEILAAQLEVWGDGP